MCKRPEALHETRLTNADQCRETIDVAPRTLISGAYTKRVDYSLGLPLADDVLSLRILQQVENHTVSQGNHFMLNDRMLFSHVEIKKDMSSAEAETQLKLWVCAGFTKQEKLYMQARPRPKARPVLAPQPVWIWERDRVKLLIVVADSRRGIVYFLEQSDFLVKDVKSLRLLISTMVAINNWGVNEYLPWFKELIGYERLIEYQSFEQNG